MIQRILHGHYADPKSTRDITGLSGKHLECLINLLQTCVLGGQMLQDMKPEEARQYLQSFSGDTPLSDKEVKQRIAAELEGAKCLADILEGINQPYEGAVYPTQPKKKPSRNI